MAPAAADTIHTHLTDYQIQPSEYDKIITGDLGYIGQTILLDLLDEKGWHIADRHMDYTLELARKLEAAGMRISVDDRAEKVGYKIRQAVLEKVPYMLTIGDNEVESKTVSVRSRRDGDLGSMTQEALLAKLVEEVATKKR